MCVSLHIVTNSNFKQALDKVLTNRVKIITQLIKTVIKIPEIGNTISGPLIVMIDICDWLNKLMNYSQPKPYNKKIETNVPFF